jgi:hypothetical protein
MANKDLFKQAIAEAKSIREAAIANAKSALEETLTPHLKDLLAAKLQEMEDSEKEEEIKEVEGVEEEAVVAEVENEEEDAMEEAKDDSEESEDEAGEEESEEAEGEEAEEASEEEVEVKDMEVDDLKALIRDILAQELGQDADAEEVPGEEMPSDDMVGAEAQPEEEEIDLEELLSELAEMDSKEEEKEVAEIAAEETVSEEEVSEDISSTADFVQQLPMIIGGMTALIGGSVAVSAWHEKALSGGYGETMQKFAKKLQGVGSAAANARNVAEAEGEQLNEMSPDMVTLLQGLAGAGALVGGAAGLSVWMDKAVAGEYGEKVAKIAKALQATGSAASAAIHREGEEELAEAVETVNTLKAELAEVNLLNAKLLYVNKVFKANNLTESQKVNVIAAFDKAETVKEVKLVFETVAENIPSKKESVSEAKLGMASKATGTTASKPEVIAEVSDAVRRMQKLAGIIK